MMPPSVLFCLPHPAYGGAERLVATLMHDLTDHNIVCRLACLSHNSAVPTSLHEWFSPFFETFALDDVSSSYEALWQIITAHDVSTLIICGLSPVFQLLPQIKAARPDLRIVSFQFNALECIAENRTYCAWIDLCIVESMEAARALSAGCEHRLPFVVISSAVDVQAICAIQSRTVRSSRICVGFIGRYDAAKNPDGFVRMAAMVADYDLRLVMAGSGQKFSKTQRLIRQLGLLDRIEQKGLLSDHRLHSMLDEIDILVVPSIIDGRPLMIQEAQARRIAVVASRVGGIPELVEDHVTGLLCAPDDAAALAAAVVRLAVDEEERCRLTEAAFQRVCREGDIRDVLPKYRSALLGEEIIAS